MSRFRLGLDGIRRVSRKLIKLGSFARTNILRRCNPQNSTNSSALVPAVANFDTPPSRHSEKWSRLRGHGILGSKLALIAMVAYRTYSMGVWSDIETTNLLAADIQEQLLELFQEFVEERHGPLILSADKDRPFKVNYDRMICKNEGFTKESFGEVINELSFTSWSSMVTSLFSGLGRAASSISQTESKTEVSEHKTPENSCPLNGSKNDD